MLRTKPLACLVGRQIAGVQLTEDFLILRLDNTTQPGQIVAAVVRLGGTAVAYDTEGNTYELVKEEPQP